MIRVSLSRLLPFLQNKFSFLREKTEAQFECTVLLAIRLPRRLTPREKAALFSFLDRGLGCCLRARQFLFADQLLKKCPVVNHCLTQVFRAGLTLGLTNGDFVS